MFEGEGNELKGNGLELGLRAFVSEVAGNEVDELDDGANESSKSLSSQSMRSSKLMKDWESGRELNEAVGRSEEENVELADEDRTAVGVALVELFAEEAEGSCSIAALRSEG